MSVSWTKQDIESLPYCAKLAFLGRCAERVAPLYTHLWPDAPEEHVQALARSIGLIRQMSNGDSVNPVEIKESADAARRAAMAAYERAGQTENVHLSADAHEAALTVQSATRGWISAASLARTASLNSGATEEMAESIRRDLDLVTAAVKQEHWGDETPVPPGFFGPLWPDGAPENWPKDDGPESQAESALRLHFSIPQEMDKDEADRIIQDIMVAANELHLAYGGSGLKLADRVHVYEPALVPAGGDE